MLPICLYPLYIDDRVTMAIGSRMLTSMTVAIGIEQANVLRNIRKKLAVNGSIKVNDDMEVATGDGVAEGRIKDFVSAIRAFTHKLEIAPCEVILYIAADSLVT
ncbi:hypothetical protein Tco_0932265 [Tanacetum coccineum]